MDEKDWDYAKGFESTFPKKKKIICYIIGIGLFTAIMLGTGLIRTASNLSSGR